eukprot:3897243-Prymnesium_polylepis.1
MSSGQALRITDDSQTTKGREITAQGKDPSVNAFSRQGFRHVLPGVSAQWKWYNLNPQGPLLTAAIQIGRLWWVTLC